MQRRNRLYNSIRFRIMLSYLFITLLGFAVVLFSVSGIVENFLSARRIADQQEKLYMVSSSLANDLYNSEGEALFRMTSSYAQSLDGRLLVLDNRAVVQVDSQSTLNGRSVAYAEVTRVLWGGEGSAFAYHMQNNPNSGRGISERFRELFGAKEQWVVYYVNSIEYNGEKIGAVLLSASIQDVIDNVAQIRTRVTLVLLVVMIAILLASYFTSRSITRPIAKLTNVIRRMSRGELDQRVQVTSDDEIGDLGRTFNDMSDRLENIERFRSEFVSNASHEIKTPLATMKILIESLLYQEKMEEGITREFLGDVNKEIDRLNLVISDLLRMVQLDQAESELKIERVSVDSLCANVVKRLGPIAQKKQITLNTELAVVHADIDSIKFEQVVTNLVDNAIKYTDSGGTVSVRTKQQSGNCIIEVEDNGIGIPDRDVTHVFDRFYRVDKARSRATGGTGLGLSIVERIVKLHGGEIKVQSKEGEGSVFTVILPIK